MKKTPDISHGPASAVPGEVMGEETGAVLVPVDGQGIDLDQVIACCGERLAGFWVAQFVAVALGSLPRNGGGKLLKAGLARESPLVLPPAAVSSAAPSMTRNGYVESFGVMK